ncbi:MAG: hypothetical protein WC608_02955 [Parcubacteria group bacterium]
MKEKFTIHPSYLDGAEDLEIKNSRELEQAKKAAGVTNHEEVMKRFNESEKMLTEDPKYQKRLELLSNIKESGIKEGDEVVVSDLENVFLPAYPEWLSAWDKKTIIFGGIKGNKISLGFKVTDFKMDGKSTIRFENVDISKLNHLEKK